MTTTQECCKGCGKCCKQGGPALHREDLPLVRSGKIPTTSLITIRKGELAHNPLTMIVQPVAVELVKIAGAGKHWACRYHEATSGCTIYSDRPLACRTLKCWDTEDILALVEKDTLSRFDIVSEDSALLPLLREHERLYPCHDLQFLHGRRREITKAMQNDYEKKVGDELRFRMQVVAEFQLSLGDELFYFGRPLFQLLQALGVRTSQSSAGIRLHWDKERSSLDE